MRDMMDGVLYERNRADKAEARIDRLLEGLEGLGWPCKLDDLPAHVRSLNEEIRRLNTLIGIGKEG